MRSGGVTHILRRRGGRAASVGRSARDATPQQARGGADSSRARRAATHKSSAHGCGHRTRAHAQQRTSASSDARRKPHTPAPAHAPQATTTRVLARLCQPPPAVHRACAASPTATRAPPEPTQHVHVSYTQMHAAQAALTAAAHRCVPGERAGTQAQRPRAVNCPSLQKHEPAESGYAVCFASPTATPVPCCAMPPPHSRGSAASPSMQQAPCNSG